MPVRRVSTAAAVAAGFAAIAAGLPAAAVERLAGPVPAEVVRVIDGDTIEVRALIWLGQELAVRVRLSGIDAPELRGRCRREREQAAAATAALAAAARGRVTLSNIAGDKYFGRVEAEVTTAAGDDLARLMLAGGFARPYDGGRRGDWCGAARRDG